MVAYSSLSLSGEYVRVYSSYYVVVSHALILKLGKSCFERIIQPVNTNSQEGNKPVQLRSPNIEF
jgi:hypothetical protein